MMMKKFLTALHRTENGVAGAVLLLMAAIPALEVVVRKVFSTGVPNSSDYLQHLVLWTTFLAGAIASRERRHLSLSAGMEFIPEGARRWIYAGTGFLSSAICTAFAWCALSMAVIGFDPTRRVGPFSIQLIAAIMPFGYAVMAARFVTGAPTGRAGKIIAATGILLGTFISLGQIASVFPGAAEGLAPAVEASQAAAGFISLPVLILLIAAALVDTPIFIVLGGAAYFLFVRSGASLEVIPNEAYTLLTGSAIPAIPLFALTGFILSEGKAGERLIGLFRALFGWLPGGMAVMAILVCAFFTTFTGASGVTILALGGLLAYILTKGGYREGFSSGLVTSSGSIGLLFPPSLPVILYGVVSQISIRQMYAGGIIPGLVMVAVLSAMGVRAALRSGVKRVPFDPREALRAIRGSIWEILLPVIIMGGFFSGLMTIVETSSVAVLYALFVAVVIQRDIRPGEIPRVLLKCFPIIGGILVILALAKGLSYYIVDAEIPMHLSEWMRAHIHSKYVFLLLLNIALILTGCLMDIYSAIMVVVPLIIPLGEIFGIHPVHLGIIFLANLELGYLTPPVGLNLFLSSYLFNRPLISVYRQVLPFLLVLIAAVLVITYVPFISTALLDVVGQ